MDPEESTRFKVRQTMTLPDERYRAIKTAERFLLALATDAAYKDVPQEVRDQARACLRHYPNGHDLALLTRLAPHVINDGREDLERFVHSREDAAAAYHTIED